jgi:tripeptidyl-peptidase-1
LITSGGGFSHYYPAPKWQQAAIKDYFRGVSTPPVAGFNKSGRAYPDVSFIGVKYNVMVRGNLYQRYGTSASAPVFAAMISLLNAHRLGKALGPVGFINPTLYSAGAAALFNDITVGENKCCIGFSDPVCCQTGFTASKGTERFPSTSSYQDGMVHIIFSVSKLIDDNLVRMGSSDRPRQRELP